MNEGSAVEWTTDTGRVQTGIVLGEFHDSPNWRWVRSERGIDYPVRLTDLRPIMLKKAEPEPSEWPDEFPYGVYASLLEIRRSGSEVELCMRFSLFRHRAPKRNSKETFILPAELRIISQHPNEGDFAVVFWNHPSDSNLSDNVVCYRYVRNHSLDTNPVVTIPAGTELSSNRNL